MLTDLSLTSAQGRPISYCEAGARRAGPAQHSTDTGRNGMETVMMWHDGAGAFWRAFPFFLLLRNF